MRTVYKKKRDVLVKAITEIDENIEILGAEAGLHLLIYVANGMTENQLISSAAKLGVKIYGMSTYYHEKYNINEKPLILIGFATMTEKEIISAVTLLKKAWYLP